MGSCSYARWMASFSQQETLGSARISLRFITSYYGTHLNKFRMGFGKPSNPARNSPQRVSAPSPKASPFKALFRPSKPAARTPLGLNLEADGQPPENSRLPRAS